MFSVHLCKLCCTASGILVSEVSHSTTVPPEWDATTLEKFNWEIGTTINHDSKSHIKDNLIKILF